MLAFCNDDPARNSPPAKPTTTTALSVEGEAKQIAQNRCGMCHGPSGRGNGPSAVTLNPKPRDLGNADWQKSVTDAQVHAVILKGGPTLGKSPLMPANPDLEAKPQVVDELVKIVRGYATK